MNHNASDPNMADNISDGSQRGGRPTQEFSPQIRIKKVSATNPIDAIMLKSKIHGRLVNSYFKKFKTINTCELRNLSSFEFCLINEIIEMITKNEATQNLMRKWHVWWINNLCIKNDMEFGVIHLANNQCCRYIDPSFFDCNGNNPPDKPLNIWKIMWTVATIKS